MIRRPRSRAWLVAPFAIALVGLLGHQQGVAAPVPGSQGTDTALPLTESAVTLRGRGSFSNLEVTVNQTRNLTNQAVSITWRGAAPTIDSGGSRFGENYLQIFQCWGEDDGTNAANPGPPPEQCQFGATTGQYGFSAGAGYPLAQSMTRVISADFWPEYRPGARGVVDPSSGRIWLPFRSVTGQTVDIQEDPTFNPGLVGGNYWLNPFFNIITTNEIPGAYTYRSGTGAELFQVDTGLQSPGLGCGQRVENLPDGSKRVPKCWIVIVPRGGAAAENVGTPDEENASQRGVTTSPLRASVWANRIAVPIEFNPVDSPCSLADVERRISGSEVPQLAVSSWQPVLCTAGDLPPYSYSVVGDSSARQQLTAPRAGAPGMVVVSRPISGAADPASPVVYAPLTVSGLVIGANIERVFKFDAPDGSNAIAGTRVAELNLTPRLVAKLLTQSYRGQVSVGNEDPEYSWDDDNPIHLNLDPDFLRFNPEFEILRTDQRIFGGLQLPSGNSDAASQIWEWILADPEARAWMGGEADEWGMRVNPAYSTNPSINPNGNGFGDPLPTSFPKADPFCFVGEPQKAQGSTAMITPPPLCGTDWMPYNRGLLDGARVARAASDGARINRNSFAISASDIWKRAEAQFMGQRSMLALTDSASASRFGLQMARLSRSGDNGSTRTFIAPDATGLTLGVSAMAPKTAPTFLEPAQNSAVPGAYPLTVVTYAATKPLQLDATARAEYAAFLDYAAGPGQVPGSEYGELPAGYIPLPADLVARTSAAAVEVRTMVAPTPPATTQPPAVAPASVDVSSQPSAAGGGTASVGSSAASSSSGGRPTSGPSGSGGSSSGSSNSGSAAQPPSDEVPATTIEVVTSEAPDTTVAPAADASADQVAPTTTTAVATTPSSKLGTSRFLVVGVGVLAIAGALGSLEITKRTRRIPAGVGSLEQVHGV